MFHRGAVIAMLKAGVRGKHSLWGITTGFRRKSGNEGDGAASILHPGTRITMLRAGVRGKAFRAENSLWRTTTGFRRTSGNDGKLLMHAAASIPGVRVLESLWGARVWGKAPHAENPSSGDYFHITETLGK